MSLVRGVPSNKILNTLSFAEFKKTIKENRKIRAKQRIRNPIVQMDMWSAPSTPTKMSWITAKISSKNILPTGPSVIGIDLTASKVKLTGMAKLDKNQVEVISLSSDDDILDYIKKNKPKFVSIDSPLGLPGGGKKINGDDGIVEILCRNFNANVNMAKNVSECHSLFLCVEYSHFCIVCLEWHFTSSLCV